MVWAGGKESSKLVNGRQVVLFTAGGAGEEMVTTERTTASATSVVSRTARCGGVTLMSLMWFFDVSGANDRTNGG